MRRDVSAKALPGCFRGFQKSGFSDACEDVPRIFWVVPERWHRRQNVLEMRVHSSERPAKTQRMRHLALHQHALVIAGIVQGNCAVCAGQYLGAVEAP